MNNAEAHPDMYRNNEIKKKKKIKANAGTLMTERRHEKGRFPPLYFKKERKKKKSYATTRVYGEQLSVYDLPISVCCLLRRSGSVSGIESESGNESVTVCSEREQGSGSETWSGTWSETWSGIWSGI